MTWPRAGVIPFPRKLEPLIPGSARQERGSDMGTKWQAAMFDTMAQHPSDNLIPSSVSSRAQITAAIEDLAAEVAHLARKLDCILPSANPQENAEKLEFEATRRGTFAVTTRAALPAEAEDATNVPLSPQKNTEIKEDSTGELNADLKTSLPEPAHTRCREENAIAERVADLYERLGGFIKPSLPKTLDPNT